MRNISEAIVILAAWQIAEDVYHEDVSAWGAPSECHDLVRRGARRRFYSAARQALAVAGSAKRIKQAANDMGHRGQDRLMGQLYGRMSPFAGGKL